VRRTGRNRLGLTARDTGRRMLGLMARGTSRSSFGLVAGGRTRLSSPKGQSGGGRGVSGSSSRWARSKRTVAARRQMLGPGNKARHSKKLVLKKYQNGEKSRGKRQQKASKNHDMEALVVEKKDKLGETH
jgi:hypothetical protein